MLSRSFRGLFPRTGDGHRPRQGAPKGAENTQFRATFSTYSPVLLVTVAGVKATSQTFSAVTQLSSLFNDDPIDGILGLAFQDIGEFDQEAFSRELNVFRLRVQRVERHPSGGTDEVPEAGAGNC